MSNRCRVRFQDDEPALRDIVENKSPTNDRNSLGYGTAVSNRVRFQDDEVALRDIVENKSPTNDRNSLGYGTAVSNRRRVRFQDDEPALPDAAYCDSSCAGRGNIAKYGPELIIDDETVDMDTKDGPKLRERSVLNLFVDASGTIIGDSGVVHTTVTSPDVCSVTTKIGQKGR